MQIKKTPKGTIILYNDVPILVFKGTTYALPKSNIKFFDVTPELRRELVEISIRTINMSSRDTQKVYRMIDDISFKYSFEYTLGPLKLSSCKRFDDDFMKF